MADFVYLEQQIHKMHMEHLVYLSKKALEM